MARLRCRHSTARRWRHRPRPLVKIDGHRVSDAHTDSAGTAAATRDSAFEESLMPTRRPSRLPMARMLMLCIALVGTTAQQDHLSSLHDAAMQKQEELKSASAREQEGLVSASSDARESVQNQATEARRKLDAASSDVSESMQNKVEQAQANAASASSDVAESVQDKATDVQENAASAFSDVAESVQDKATEAQANAASASSNVRESLQGKETDVQENVASASSDVSESVQDKATEAQANAASASSNVRESLQNKAREAQANLASASSNAGESIQSKLREAKAAAANIGSAAKDAAASATDSVTKAVPEVVGRLGADGGDASVKRGKPMRLGVALRAARPWSFTATVSPVLLGSALAFQVEDARSATLLLLSLITTISVHAAGNLMNTLFDFRNGMDSPSSSDLTLVNGELTDPQVSRLIKLAYAVAAAAALPLCALSPAPLPQLVGLLGAGAASAFVYTGGPGLKYKALGDLLISGTFGPLLVCFSFLVQVGKLGWAPLLASLPLTAHIEAILHANNARDAEEDAAHGIITFSSILGERNSVAFYAFLVGAPFVAAAVDASRRSALALLPMLALPAAIRLVRDFARGKLQRMPMRTAKFQFVFGMLFVGATLLPSPSLPAVARNIATFLRNVL